MEVEKTWKETTKILLGQELEDINRYEQYLQKFVKPVTITKSAISGSEIAVFDEYSSGTRFISGDEIAEYQQMMEKDPLDINQIKDIDSIVDALREKIYYAGDVKQGKTTGAVLSHRLIDSMSVLRSNDVISSKHVAYSDVVRYSENIYGSADVSKTKVSIKGFETYIDNRVMEVVRTYESSDCYYTANVDGCQNCLFCFNIRNRRNCIGNLQLMPDKFIKVKSKLLEDIRETLVSKRTLPSVSELIGEVG